MNNLKSQEIWNNYLRRYEIIKNRNLPHVLNPVDPNPLLANALASILIVNLASVLDESLGIYVTSNGFTGRKDDLYSKIEILNAEGRLSTAIELHELRKERNILAHSDMEDELWPKLDKYIDLVNSIFLQLGLISERPNYEAFFERNPIPPNRDDIEYSFANRFGLRKDGREIMVFESRTDYLRDDSGYNVTP